MKHSFYSLSNTEQAAFVLKLAALFILLNLVLGTLLYFCGLVFLSLFIFAISLSVFAPFVDVPSGVKSGSLRYYSTLLIGEKIKNNRLVLHGGSLFDYYFTLDFNQTAPERKKQVLSALIDGLLILIAEHEHGKPTAIRIHATSYILNPRTAKKLGLHVCQTDVIQQLILYFNFVNLTCSLSFLTGRLTLPNMKKIYSFEGELNALIANKAYLQRLHARL
ncbi:hypothetical protein [Pseudoalteromonas tunicata]|jgi:hypothetical protein|uniref:Uncharacterized protein n=1 Tax=Pseudoalteromonas tunicata D2 TaxID=87626 RepID=A4C3J6_9GAMM|nr:hypothetical protein [Pseudoalteromonas tunicata]ATC96590.1 hypothetical protein PTUN_b0140 [Pseudoalteromonas tunicata]AXT32775.1 hypothetical protein D1819_18145 [Pseudoalteromonas tunicata]EAR30128.1 hypothetical protein PTD2_01126 [Pseudoalteromonas tunicata D2]MDP4984136.1 hypothetical protein [Pseudoalteromonas tunicata]MDP5214512.1 hypothetical protein [Pseudoalteromonas tunicata]